MLIMPLASVISIVTSHYSKRVKWQIKSLDEISIFFVVSM
jgi:hypothetical protein